MGTKHNSSSYYVTYKQYIFLWILRESSISSGIEVCPLVFSHYKYYHCYPFFHIAPHIAHHLVKFVFPKRTIFVTMCIGQKERKRHILDISIPRHGMLHMCRDSVWWLSVMTGCLYLLKISALNSLFLFCNSKCQIWRNGISSLISRIRLYCILSQPLSHQQIRVVAFNIRRIDLRELNFMLVDRAEVNQPEIASSSNTTNELNVYLTVLRLLVKVSFALVTLIMVRKPLKALKFITMILINTLFTKYCNHHIMLVHFRFLIQGSIDRFPL